MSDFRPDAHIIGRQWFEASIVNRAAACEAALARLMVALELGDHRARDQASREFEREARGLLDVDARLWTYEQKFEGRRR
jgi:hypothetical protein